MRYFIIKTCKCATLFSIAKYKAGEVLNIFYYKCFPWSITLLFYLLYYILINGLCVIDRQFLYVKKAYDLTLYVLTVNTFFLCFKKMEFKYFHSNFIFKFEAYTSLYSINSFKKSLLRHSYYEHYKMVMLIVVVN